MVNHRGLFGAKVKFSKVRNRRAYPKDVVNRPRSCQRRVISWFKICHDSQKKKCDARCVIFGLSAV